MFLLVPWLLAIAIWVSIYWWFVDGFKSALRAEGLHRLATGSPASCTAVPRAYWMSYYHYIHNTARSSLHHQSEARQHMGVGKNIVALCGTHQGGEGKPILAANDNSDSWKISLRPRMEGGMNHELADNLWRWSLSQIVSRKWILK